MGNTFSKIKVINETKINKGIFAKFINRRNAMDKQTKTFSKPKPTSAINPK